MVLCYPDFMTTTGAFVNAPKWGAGSGFVVVAEHGTEAVRQVSLFLIKRHCIIPCR